MAVRNNPYLPLYVQDFMTDERLAECSAKATGVYIRLMCLMHKSEEYGKILLKQKDKQSDNQVENFAVKIAKHFPYDLTTVHNALTELVNESVLRIDGDYLIQKRMVRDAELSDIRSRVGAKGGKRSASRFAKPKAMAKIEANTDNENDIEIVNKEKVEFKKFEVWIIKNANNVSKMKEPFTIDQYREIKTKYKSDVVKDVLVSMHNHAPLLKKNISAYLTLLNWLKRREENPLNSTPVKHLSEVPRRDGPPLKTIEA